MSLVPTANSCTRVYFDASKVASAIRTGWELFLMAPLSSVDTSLQRHATIHAIPEAMCHRLF